MGDGMEMGRNGLLVQFVAVVCVESFRVNVRYPEREVAVLKTVEDATVAMFGYFDPRDQWHFMIVPNEFRRSDTLDALRAELLQTHDAVLQFVTGDTIDWTPEQKRRYRLFRIFGQPVMN